MHQILQTSLSALIYNCTLLLFIFELNRAHNWSATHRENYQIKLQTLTQDPVMSGVMQGVTRGTLTGDDLTMPGEGEWREAGAVDSLYIYPVKSMAPVRVDTFSVEQTGPR